jgi:hypothetical protein
MVLTPVASNTNPSASIWDDSLAPGARQWLAGTPVALERTSLLPGQSALIIPPSVPVEERALLGRASSLLIDVPLGNAVALSAFSVQLGAWLLRDGEVQPEPPGRAERWGAHHSVVAVDASGRRALLASTGSRERATVAVNWGGLGDLMLEEGMVNAVILPGDEPRLLPDNDASEWRRDRQPIAARLALVPTALTPELRLGGDTPYLPILVSTVAGTNQYGTTNTPSRLIDGMAAADEGLDTFWVGQAPLDGLPGTAPRADELPFVEFALAGPARLAALDLAHAEVAGFSPSFNLKAYRVLGRARAFSDWEVLAEVRHETPVPNERVRIDPPRRLEAVRLEVIEPNFLAGGRTARLAEVVLWGEGVVGN